MNERVSYEPPADVQKTGVEDAASRPRFRTFSAGALNFHRTPPCLPSGTTMSESVSYEPPADVQKTGEEDTASRPRFRTFSAGALNFHSKVLLLCEIAEVSYRECFRENL